MPAPANLIHETSSSTGTGNFTLAAVNGKVRFSDATYGFGTGGSDTFYYFISSRDAAEWEHGTGHMSDANTLVRDTVAGSSNSNAAVSFSAGTKDVVNDIPAANQLRTDQIGSTIQAFNANLAAIAALTTDAAGRSTLELTDPGADRLAFWDESAGTSGAMAWLTPGSGLTLTGTTLAASSSFRNKLINGSMVISQRATSFTSTRSANNDDTYNLDRWVLLSDGNNIVNVSQDTADVPTGSKFAWKASVVTVNKKFGALQIIENRDCTGLINNSSQVVTLSFKAKVSNVTRLATCKAVVLAWNSTADVVTSDVVSAWGADSTTPTWATNWTAENTPADLNFTTSWATYSLQATLDTASTANLAVFVWSDNVTDTYAGDTFHVTDVQLEAGSTATAFERILPSLQHDLCRRYYELYDVGYTGDVTSTNDYGVIASWNSEKFATPTIAHISDIQHAGFNTGAPTANSTSVYGARLTKAATTTAGGRLWYVRISITSEL